MGRPKAYLPLGGEIQILRTARLLRSVCARVAAAGRIPGNFRPAREMQAQEGREGISFCSDPLVVIEDVLPGLGPLGGIYSGLLSTRTEFNLFAGCDMPLLTARLLRILARRAFASEADVTVPEAAGGGFQGCCAIYRRRARAVIRASLGRGRSKVSDFYPRIRLEVIRWQEIRRQGFGPDIFMNMNAPMDYLAAKSAIEGRSQG